MIKSLSMEEENKIINNLIEYYSISHDLVYYKTLSLEEQFNKNIILTAIKLDANSFKYVPDNLKEDRKFILEAVKQNGLILYYLSEKFKNDEEIVFDAIKQDPKSLNYASDDLKSDRNFVFKLIDNNINHMLKGCSILQYLPDNIENDHEIVLRLIKSGSDSLFGSSKDLCDDREFVLQVVKHDGDSFMFASETVRNDKEIILESIKTNTKRMNEILENFNEKFISFAQLTNKNHHELKYYLPTNLKNDRNIILALVKQDGSTIKIASYTLQIDEEIIAESKKRNIEIVKCAYSKLNNENIEKFQKYYENKYK